MSSASVAMRPISMTPGEALGFLLAPLAAALVCALPLLLAGSPAGAASVAGLYLAVLGLTPNVALGRRALAWAKVRRPLTLGLSVAGGALVKIAVLVLLAVVGPLVLLIIEHEGDLFARWSGLAIFAAWALLVAAALGALEGGVFWSIVRWRDGRLASAIVAGRS